MTAVHDHATALDLAPEGQRIDLPRQAPNFFRAMVALATTETRVSPSLKHLVKLRASQINGCAYCVSMHSREARADGETERRLHMLAVWHEAPDFTADERAALALTEAITLVADGHVPEPVYRQAAERFDEATLAELIWHIAIINTWNRIAITGRKAPES